MALSSGDIIVLVCHVIYQHRNTIWVGATQAKSPSFQVWHYGGRNIIVFACHVALQDHVLKGLNDFMVRSPSRYVTILPSLVAMWRYNGFSLSPDLARPRDQRAMWLYGWESIKVNYHPTKFRGWRFSFVQVTSQDQSLMWLLSKGAPRRKWPSCQVW